MMARSVLARPRSTDVDLPLPSPPMNGFRRALLVLATSSALVACGSEDCTDPCDPGSVDGGLADAGPSPIDASPSSVDGGTTPDAGAPEDGGGPRVDAAPPPFQAIEPCMEPGDYRDGTYVSASDSLQYDPPCLRVRQGGSVYIEASTGHPLAARAVGSPGNPIPSVSDSVTVTFDALGFYPYVCTLHASQGMIGVVQVVP